ncbi:hypothetical protein ACFTRD_20695 [Paenibacillus sp. NPDC056933]|uniref:hypothetical protein n=1 Tax=Paenibacillus sp. NPDC056933 TaxID=3345968 RepID=UPI0036312CD5
MATIDDFAALDIRVGTIKEAPRCIAGFKSEVLVLGGVPEKGDVILLKPDTEMPNGTPIA